VNGPVDHSDTLYTQKECGCLVLVVVDDPETLKSCANDIARELKAGRTIHRATYVAFRDVPFRCPEHKRQAEAAGRDRGQKRRPVFGEPTTGSRS
jgi:hypothetical protein